MSKFDKTVEVEWGEAHEEDIFKRWRESSPNAKGAHFAIPGPPYADWDRIIFTIESTPVCYLEIKRRRIPFAKFGDVVLPDRKIVFAVKEGAEHRLPFFIVTEYSCGTLAEVDLSQEPDERFLLQRRDRSGKPPVPHVRYEGEKVRVLQGAG